MKNVLYRNYQGLRCRFWRIWNSQRGGNFL
jgi:hypothetical protein